MPDDSRLTSNVPRLPAFLTAKTNLDGRQFVGRYEEEEGTRWSHRSSKPAWRALRSPEGSTPSPLRHPDFVRFFKMSRHDVTPPIWI